MECAFSPVHASHCSAADERHVSKQVAVGTSFRIDDASFGESLAQSQTRYHGVAALGHALVFRHAHQRCQFVVRQFHLAHRHILMPCRQIAHLLNACPGIEQGIKRLRFAYADGRNHSGSSYDYLLCHYFFRLAAIYSAMTLTDCSTALPSAGVWNLMP